MHALLITLCLARAPAPLNDVDRMDRAFAQSEFEEAVSMAQRVLDKPGQDKAALMRARRTAAFSYFYLNKRELAADQLAALFKLDPDAMVDPKRHPPQLVDFFYRFKQKYAVKEAPLPRPTPAPATTVVARPAPAPRFNPVSLVPFGIGQMLQGDILFGAIFLGADAAIFATNLGLYLARVKDRQPGDAYADPARANRLQLGQNIAAFALIGAVAWGVVDSVLFSPGRVAKKNAARAALLPGVGPEGAGATLVVAF